MRDVYQVLREKELEISQVRQEIEALRAAIPLLADGGELEPTEAPAFTPMRAVNSD
jgi:hypothetical protein